MAYEDIEARLRRKIGDNDSGNQIFDDTELSDIYDEAAELQSTDALIFQQAVVLAYEEMLADSVKLVTYKANHASENMSDVFKHLQSMLALHRQKLSDLQAQSPIQYAALKKRDTRIKDLPNA